MYKFSCIPRGGKKVKVLTTDPVVLGSAFTGQVASLILLPFPHGQAGGPPGTHLVVLHSDGAMTHSGTRQSYFSETSVAIFL